VGKIMRRIILLVMFAIITSVNATAQLNYKNIPTEDKYPVQILESDDEVVLYKARTMRYDRLRKRLYVANSGDHNILVFDDDLKYIGSFGREGQGPGEFEQLQGMDICGSGKLVVAEWGRIQVFDESYHYLSGFPVNLYGFGAWRICVDSRDNIYINDAKSDSLFYICDYNGNQLEKFGSIYPYQYRRSIAIENRVLFYIDSHDDLFCVFENYPILRKYDREHNLVFKKNVENLPEVKWRKKWWDKRSAHRVAPNLYLAKVYFIGFCVDEQYINLSCNTGPGPEPVYVFDKLDGKLVKKLLLHPSVKDEITPGHFLECDDQYIYTIEISNMRVLRYEK